MNVEQSTTSGVASESSLARNAGLLSLGNVASRLFGLLREIVIAHFFGASGQVSAFRIAAQAPTLFYDLLIGGMLSAALAPVLSDYARRDRTSFVRLAQTLLSLFAVGLALLTLLLILTAPLLTGLLAAGFRSENPELLALTTRLIRLASPLVWLLGMTGVLTAILFAQQRFHFPALATAIYNLGIVLAAPLLAPRLGVLTLVIGLLIGGLAQMLLLAGDVRWGGVGLPLRIEWRHPAIRKILLLYAPIAAGMVVALLQVGLDRRLASATGEQSIAWMANATTLQQMPLGLISVAIALAALPQLSQQYAAREEAAFRRTLGRGLRLVLLLMAPVVVLFWLLGEPMTRLVFERGAFTPADTQAVARALTIYAVGMFFAALDFPLNYAFYARNNTHLPALVGVLSVGAYMLVAWWLLHPLGYLGLVWADTAKQVAHAVIMLALVFATIGWPAAGSLRTVAAILAASGVMAAGMLLARYVMTPLLPQGRLGDLLSLLVVGGAGGLLYALALRRAGVSEAALVWTRLGRWWTRR
jgi:putative peptidoglycan lipid II flippase